MPEDVLEPDGSAFFGVRHEVAYATGTQLAALRKKVEDLPYSSERKSPRFSGPPPSLKDEGAMLLSALTGVVNTNRKSSVPFLKIANLPKSYGDFKAKLAASVDPLQEYQVSPTAKRLGTISSGDGALSLETSFYEGRGLRRATQGPTDRSPRPAVASLAHTPRRMSLGQCAQLSDRRRSSGEGSSFRSPRPPRSPRRVLRKDEACDTSDMPMIFVESDDELLMETVPSLDLERQRMEDPMKKNKLALDDYMGKLKATTNRLGLRASMLHELSTEDIESSYRTLPPPPVARRLSAPQSGLELEVEEEKATAGQHVKQARRLAGSMNVYQQTNGLRDIHKWLQHLGSIAQEEDFADLGGARFKEKDMEMEEGDWRLPSSPAMALQLAQEDLRNRLGILYAERQDVLNRQAQLMAATKLATSEGDAEESRLREFLRRMHMLEDEYHMLGEKLAEDVSEAENLDRRHHRLRKDIRDSDQHAAHVKRRPSVAEEDQRTDAHTDAKHRASKKKHSKVEDPRLEEPGTAGYEIKKKARPRSSQDQNGEGAAAGSPTADEAPESTPESASVSAPAHVGGTSEASSSGSLVTATPAPETTRAEELEDYALDTGTVDDVDEKQDPKLSESIGTLLEDSDEEPEETVMDDGPDFTDIAIRKRKPRKKTRNQDEKVLPGIEDEGESGRKCGRKCSGKRRAEGDVAGFDYSNVSSLYESQSTPDAKVKYSRDDRKRSGSTRRSALEWKILLESGQCKHRSCQTDPSITERHKKARTSQEARSRRDSDSTPQMDNKELQREIVRLKERLRFWRSRNWAQQHKTQPIATGPSGPQYMIDDNSIPVMHHSSSETNDSRGAEGTTTNPSDLERLQGASSLRGRDARGAEDSTPNPYDSRRQQSSSSLQGGDSVSVSNSLEPDQVTVIHEESLRQGDLLPDRVPSFVVFGTSPNHTPRDSRVGSLLPARETRVGSLVQANPSRNNSRGSLPIWRNSPGAEALRLQAIAAAKRGRSFN